MNQDTRNTTFIVIIVFALFVLGYIFIPKAITNNRLERAATIARSQDLQTGYCFTNIQDWWNNDICVKRELAQEGMAVGYIAISAGRDGTFDTSDDYQAVKIDKNYSKMFGKVAMKSAKEVVKGARSELFTKSKFDDTEGKKEIGEPAKPETKKFNWKFWKKEK